MIWDGGRPGRTEGAAVEEGEGEEEEVVVHDFETGKTIKTRKRGTKGSMWRIMEDEVSCEAWKLVSYDPITDVNQNFKRYWERIADQLNETGKYVMFIKYHMDRNDNAMSYRWKTVDDCNLFQGDLEQIRGK